MTDSTSNDILCIGADGNITVVNTSNNKYKYKEFKVDGPLSAYDVRNSHIAVGGRENDLKLYDIKTQRKIWSAKNVPDDKLQLRVPIWITAITHINDNPHLIATGTGHKHLRVYDTNVNYSQPICTIDYSEEYHITSIASSKDGNGIYLADTSGGLHLYDRRKLKRISTYHGYAGSIRDIKVSSDGNYIAAVGLDRYVRIFDNNGNSSTNKEEACIFLRNRLNRVLLFHDENARKSNKRLRDHEKDLDKGDDDSDVLEDYVEDEEDDDDE
jgi:ribosome biogenesis protein NSA1